MAYSIWLLPAEADVRTYLADTVQDLSTRHDTSLFEPHMTLLGDIDLPLDVLQQKLDLIASTVSLLTLKTGEVSVSTTYYQCVFVRVQPTAQLLSLYQSACEVFDLSLGVFMPHISLLYSTMPMKQRLKVLGDVAFMQQTFTVDKMVITPSGSDVTPDKWEHLRVHDFAGSDS